MSIEETFRVKHEDTEEQTGRFPLLKCWGVWGGVCNWIKSFVLMSYGC